MKANELRLGNWVKYKNNYAKVENMSSRFIMDTSDYIGVRHTDGKYAMCVSTSFNPIELTEDVLLKIGFYKKLIGDELYRYYKEVCIDNYNYLFDFAVIPKDEYAGLKVTRAENEYDENDYSTIFYNDNIKYLHQLQNSYYLLTGQELNIKL